jgi:putative ABC transport system permease protein
MMTIPLKYNVRSLLVRRVSTAMTAAGIALVVAVFVAIMAMAAGLGSAIRESGSDRNIIVLRRGATTEADSSLTLEQFDALKFLTGIRRDAQGNPLSSPEFVLQILMPDADGALDNLPVRGLLPAGLAVHENVRVVSGRRFTPGLSEVIVGRSTVGRYRGCSLGSTLRFGRRTWQVVGVFEAGGSSFESEVWTDVHSLQEDSNHGSMYSSVRLALAPGADARALAHRIENDPRIDLQAETETEYYRAQSAIAGQLRALGLLVAGIMGMGAVFGAMNTMYASVSARTAEIGTLRALGFDPRAILTSFILESLVLAVAAGTVGVLMATPLNGFSGTFNGSITSPTLSFGLHVTLGVMAQALVFAGLMGLAGGWLPARQAMATTVSVALRRT